MAALTEYIERFTKGSGDIIDLTPSVAGIVEENKIGSGIVCVFIPGSTGAITTIEYEPGLKKDLPVFLEKIAPYVGRYHHHDTWHDDNGSSHIQAAMIGPSLSVPVVNGALMLGTWQQIVLVECDTRPRNRKIIVQIVWY